jgi:hypothetical protein
MSKLTGYELSRNFFDWCFENPEKVKPAHVAVYFFAIEHCNRLGWKPKFGFPSQMVMDAIGIKSWHTYISIFTDLVEWGFFILLEKSKNQYSSNIIALIKFDEAHIKALDKALTKHISKHQRSTYQSTYQSNDSINKQVNKEQKNRETPEQDLRTQFQTYSEYMQGEINIEQMAMQLGFTKNETIHSVNEFLEMNFAEIAEIPNKFKVKQFFFNWIKKGDRKQIAVSNQLKKQKCTK